VLLHRTRDDRELPAYAVNDAADGFLLELPARWLEDNPWTAAALNEEIMVWRRVGMQLKIKTLGAARGH